MTIKHLEVRADGFVCTVVVVLDALFFGQNGVQRQLLDREFWYRCQRSGPRVTVNGCDRGQHGAAVVRHRIVSPRLVIVSNALTRVTALYHSGAFVSCRSHRTNTVST